MSRPGVTNKFSSPDTLHSFSSITWLLIMQLFPHSLPRAQVCVVQVSERPGGDIYLVTCFFFVVLDTLHSPLRRVVVIPKSYMFLCFSWFFIKRERKVREREGEGLWGGAGKMVTWQTDWRWERQAPSHASSSLEMCTTFFFSTQNELALSVCLSVSLSIYQSIICLPTSLSLIR